MSIVKLLSAHLNTFRQIRFSTSGARLGGIEDGVEETDAVNVRQLNAAVQNGGFLLPPFAASTVIEPFTSDENGNQYLIPSALLNIIETFPQGEIPDTVYGNLITTVSRGSYWGDINVEYILGGDAQMAEGILTGTIDEGQVQAMAFAIFPFGNLGTHSVTVRVSAGGHVIENVVSLTVEENGSGSGSGGGLSSYFANFQGPFNVGGFVSFNADCFNVYTESRPGMPPFFAIRLERSPAGLNMWGEVGYFQTYNGFPVNGPITATSNLAFPDAGGFDYRLVGYDDMFQEVYSSVITTAAPSSFPVTFGPVNSIGFVGMNVQCDNIYGDMANKIYIQASPGGMNMWVSVGNTGLPMVPHNGLISVVSNYSWPATPGVDFRVMGFDSNGNPVYSQVVTTA